MRYCAHEKPQLFFSVLIGVAGPVIAVFGTPLRRSLLFADAPPIPLTYPCKYSYFIFYFFFFHFTGCSKSAK